MARRCAVVSVLIAVAGFVIGFVVGQIRSESEGLSYDTADWVDDAGSVDLARVPYRVPIDVDDHVVETDRGWIETEVLHPFVGAGDELFDGPYPVYGSELGSDVVGWYFRTADEVFQVGSAPSSEGPEGTAAP